MTREQTTLHSELMNAQASSLIRSRLLVVYPDMPLLLWDRAPWYEGEAIRSLLSANPRLEIVWFPPGCPEWNPQEHVWKAAREAVSHNHSFAKLTQLADAFAARLEKTRFPCSLLDRHDYRQLCTLSK